MTDRKRQILEQAIEIISSEGYANLSMRALARASGMKLGALQYHFRTREDLLRDLAAFVGDEYGRSFDALAEGRDSPDLRQTMQFLLEDSPADATLQADRLLPQLWAMAQVEPVMESLLDDIYRRYLDTLEERLVAEGSRAPRAEALALMSMVEGATLFLGHGRRWARDAKSVRDAVLGFIDANYPNDGNDGGGGSASASATKRKPNRRRRVPGSK
ncbi:MAG: TetR/AcrR family transcriptional regulator [Myxococcales bacterium]|nr:TetR/AcrR family transcriptional regulator [Myxococcales bacterium]HIL80712.1 TetR/AcrR family transcriptional regulator [Myxococcales bacterium]